MRNQLSSRLIRRHLLVAVGAVALTFVPLAGAGQDSANTNANQSSNASADQSVQDQSARIPHLPDGFVEKDEDGAGGIKSTMVGLTERAVTKNSYDSFFSSFLAELDKRDKARAKEFKGVKQDDLNATIIQIQNEWRSKYGQEFDISDKNLVFNEQFPIVQGEVSDVSAACASAWPAPASLADQAINAGASSEQQQCNAKELSKGQAVAVMSFPAGDDLPAIRVSLVHHIMTGWYVDIPADRTGEQIYTDLSSQLRYIGSHQDAWPSNVTDGYRMVAHRVAAALYGVGSQREPTASVQ